MTKLEKTFNTAEIFDGDAWVADYTEQTKCLPAAERVGVVMSREQLEDIDSFHLKNDNCVEFFGVNFEKHKDFFPEGRQDCECLFKAKNVNESGWVLLCELKYCRDKDKNREDNAAKAYEQLVDTWNLLNENKIFIGKKCHSFLNISMPAHKNITAFDSFLVLQDDQIEWNKKNKIHLMGRNELLVINDGRIQIPTDALAL